MHLFPKEYDPLGAGLQACVGDAEQVPGLQAKHAVLLVLVVYLPPVQAAHDVCPVKLENVPAKHG